MGFRSPSATGFGFYKKRFILTTFCLHHKNRRQKKEISFRGCWGILFLLFSSLVGCNTPFLATDNPVLLHLPGTERRSDQVDGILRPWERIELIDEKGEKGAKAPLEEKKVLAFQLIQEYQRSNDPLVRRASIQAIGKITENAHIGPALELLTESVHDPNLGNRIAACDALGHYALKVKSEATVEIRDQIALVLANAYRESSYSASAGAQKENNDRKDFRLAILRNMAFFSDSEPAFTFLAEAIDSEPLDDGALRLGAMTALGTMTGKNYGYDYDRWSQYIAYRQGKGGSAPKEIQSFGRAITEGDLAILK